MPPAPTHSIELLEEFQLEGTVQVLAEVEVRNTTTLLALAVVKVWSLEVARLPNWSVDCTWKWYVVFGVRPLSVIPCEVAKLAEDEAVPYEAVVP